MEIKKSTGRKITTHTRTHTHSNHIQCRRIADVLVEQQQQTPSLPSNSGSVVQQWGSHTRSLPVFLSRAFNYSLWLLWNFLPAVCWEKNSLSPPLLFGFILKEMWSWMMQHLATAQSLGLKQWLFCMTGAWRHTMSTKWLHGGFSLALAFDFRSKLPWWIIFAIMAKKSDSLQVHTPQMISSQLSVFDL